MAGRGMAWGDVAQCAARCGAWRAAARWVVSHRGTVCGGVVQCASCSGVWCGVQRGGSVRGMRLPDGSCRIVAWCGVHGVVGRGVACGHPTHRVTSWRGVWWCSAVRVVSWCGMAHGVRLPDVLCHIVAWCMAVQCSAQHGAACSHMRMA